MPFKNMRNQCTATSKTTGQRCPNPAVTGYTVCYHHGANPKNHGGAKVGHPKHEGLRRGPTGKQNALKHGAYTPKLQPDELLTYEALLAENMQDVPNPSVTDRHALARLAVIETKWLTAVTQGAPADALDVLHRLLHRELKALQVTRESKDTSTNQGNSPAEVVAALLMKVREHALATQRAPALPPDTGDGVVIECEVVDDGDGTDA
jgi:hypothetical protein